MKNQSNLPPHSASYSEDDDNGENEEPEDDVGVEENIETRSDKVSLKKASAKEVNTTPIDVHQPPPPPQD